MEHDRIESLVREADRCVACGLCVPVCPTYRKTLSEADSPRGRIQLMRGVMKGDLPLSDRFAEHIDLCLTCRACESVCPNRVEYDSLLRAMRAPIERRAGKISRGIRRGALFTLAHPGLLQGLGRIYARTRRLFPGRIDRMFPEKIEPVRRGGTFPAKGREHGTVGLLLGCVSRVADARTLNASIHVLNALGYTVKVPGNQGCCGALHARYGEDASALVSGNAEAFSGLDAVIGTSSACTAELARTLPAVDISAFLCDARGWEGVEIRPLEARIAVHEPCSLRNVLKGREPPYALLRRIPGAEVFPLGGNDQCCGSAGSYFLSQPEMANALLDDKMDRMAESGASIVATSNVGCAMSLAPRTGAKVMHPVLILAQQMGFK